MFLAALYTIVFLTCLAVRAKVRSRNARQVVLLAGSYAVYVAWGPWFATVLLCSTVMNFLLGRLLRRNATRLGLGAGIVLNLALLSSFKYLPPLAIELPVHFPSTLRTSRIAAGDFVLDVPGDELPVRPISRRRTGPNVR